MFLFPLASGIERYFVHRCRRGCKHSAWPQWPIANFSQRSHFHNLILNTPIRLDIDYMLHLFKSACITSLSVISVSHHFSNRATTISLQSAFNYFHKTMNSYILFLLFAAQSKSFAVVSSGLHFFSSCPCLFISVAVFSGLFEYLPPSFRGLMQKCTYYSTCSIEKKEEEVVCKANHQSLKD